MSGVVAWWRAESTGDRTRTSVGAMWWSVCVCSYNAVGSDDDAVRLGPIIQGQGMGGGFFKNGSQEGN